MSEKLTPEWSKAGIDPTLVMIPDFEEDAPSVTVPKPAPVRANFNIPDVALHTHTGTEVPSAATSAPTGSPTSDENTLSEVNPSYYGVHPELPSSCGLYDYAKLSVRPYRLGELFKLGAAAKGGRVRYVVEAVGSAIDRPIQTLAVMDFTFLCYWLRSMSYKSSPFNVHWDCEDVEHYREVALGKVEASTLENLHLLERSQITVKKLNQEALYPIAKKLITLGIAIYLPTVGDMLDVIEVSSDWTDEQCFISKYAGLLHQGHGKKLTDRIKYLQSISDLDSGVEILELLDQALVIINEAGVDDKVTVVCKHCKLSQEVKLQMDLLSFFPYALS